MKNKQTDQRKEYTKPRVRSQATLERQILATGGCTPQGNATWPPCAKNQL